MVILDGVVRHRAGSDQRMQGFARELSDRQVATLGNYLLLRYGNPASRVTVDRVTSLRARTTSAWIVWAVRAAMLVAALLVVWALAGYAARRPRRRRRSAAVRRDRVVTDT